MEMTTRLNSTTVRKFATLSAIRAAFTIGGRLFPTATADRAARLQDGQHVLDTGGVFCSRRDERGVHEPLVIDQRRNGGRGSRAVQEARDDDVSIVFPHAGN